MRTEIHHNHIHTYMKWQEEGGIYDVDDVKTI